MAEKPNVDKFGNETHLCKDCINVLKEAGTPPCTPECCEISRILTSAFQYMNEQKKLLGE